MKILIEANAEEIAALVVALQERQVELSIGQEIIDRLRDESNRIRPKLKL